MTFISSNTKTPMVSVVMATFNEPTEIIRKSIGSILNQTFSDFELLIIDDSLCEETKTAINSFSEDSRVKIIRELERLGFVKSLNVGLLLAKGKYIARMDGDDIAMENRLELQVNYLNGHPSVSVVGGSVYIIDNNDQIVSYRKYPSSNFFLKFFSTYRNPLAHPTIMMRKLCVEKGFIYDESFDKAEDLELWLRLRKNGYNWINIPNFLLKYRINDDLSQKRTKNNWSYNFMARRKNFSMRDPIFSFIGLCISFIYTKLPKFVIKKMYHKENNKTS